MVVEWERGEINKVSSGKFSVIIQKPKSQLPNIYMPSSRVFSYMIGGTVMITYLASQIGRVANLVNLLKKLWEIFRKSSRIILGL